MFLKKCYKIRKSFIIENSLNFQLYKEEFKVYSIYIKEFSFQIFKWFTINSYKTF